VTSRLVAIGLWNRRSFGSKSIGFYRIAPRLTRKKCDDGKNNKCMYRPSERREEMCAGRVCCCILVNRCEYMPRDVTPKTRHCGVKPAFHDTDTDILARTFVRNRACRCRGMRPLLCRRCLHFRYATDRWTDRQTDTRPMHYA